MYLNPPTSEMMERGNSSSHFEPRHYSEGSGYIHVLEALPEGMSPRYSLCGPQSPGPELLEKKIPFLCGESNHDNSVVQSIALSLYPPPAYFPKSPPVVRHFAHTYRGGDNLPYQQGPPLDWLLHARGKWQIK